MVTPAGRGRARVTPHGAYGAPRAGGARRHKGVDVAVAPGAPVYSPVGGRVVAVELEQRKPWRGYAPVVAVLGDDRLLHILAHVSAPSVVVGERVEAGERVASGSSAGHVHWERRRQERALDPAELGAERRRRDGLALVVGVVVFLLLGAATA